MHVTIEIEARDLPEQTVKYGGGWLRPAKFFRKERARRVQSVVATVHFDPEETDTIRRAGLGDHVIWEGPEEMHWDDKYLKWNLELPRREGFENHNPSDFDMMEVVIAPRIKHLAYKPYRRKRSTQVSNLIGGQRHIIFDCETLAGANAVEVKFKEGLVHLKQLLEFHDQPAGRVTTFEL